MFYKSARVSQLLIVLSVLLFIGLLVPTQAYAAKVNLSPSPITLTEGQSQIVTVTLDEPIICPDMDETCNVVITVTSSNQDRVSISDAPVTIPYAQWAQPFTFTITATDDQIDNGDISPVMTLLTQSNSEYYTNFVPGLTLSVLDNDEAPAQSIEPVATPGSTDSNQARLPDTGSSQTLAIAMTFLLIIGSSTLVYKKHKSYRL